MSLYSYLTGRLTPVLLSPGSEFSLLSLGAAFIIAIGFIAHRQWRRRGQVRPRVIFRAFFAGDLATHRSTRADLIYFGLNIFVTGFYISWACLGSGKVASFVQVALSNAFGVQPQLNASEWALRALVTLVAFIAYEFGYWLDHYLKHRVPALWEMHKTHHTAERLTPFTVWRVHPLDSLIFANMTALSVGGALGVLKFVIGNVSEFSIYGANVFLFIFFMTFVHLQHSQVWLPLRGWRGKFLMSPAHHQIHHSINPAHYNSNLGNSLAIFDWLFGTLVMPTKENPNLAYGVVERGVDHQSIPQLILAPFINVARALIPAAAPPQTTAFKKSAEVSQ